MTRQYSLALIDESVNSPFRLNRELALRANIIRQKKNTQSQKSFEIYTYLEQKLRYGRTNQTYGDSQEVWESKRGVCGEMSVLYISMARFCGIQSAYVHVTKDIDSRSVNHACAVSYVPGPLFVDIAYHRFNISHKEYKIITDKELFRRYQLWREK
ncbi:MAG: transglutaminase-like domain-containing protein [Candidatus Woesearchaeota archaeon]